MPGIRIGLVHALTDSIAPARRALTELWPEVETVNVLDDALARDIAASGGKATPALDARIVDLGRYVHSAGAKGVLYTCSAFGDSIKAAGRLLPIPLLRPNEAAIDAAVEAGSCIRVLSTFKITADQIKEELEAEAKARNLVRTVDSRVVAGAWDALQGGDQLRHDALIVQAAAELPPCDVLLLAQFSMSHIAKVIAPVEGRTVLTTPTSAVRKLRALCSVN